MKEKERFTIVEKSSGHHYDTYDERFYSNSWDRTYDTKKYLETLMKNHPEKFRDCHIEEKFEE